MISFRTVVCPVDLSPATDRQLDLAVDLCRASGARLVVHHNVTDVAVGAGVGWMWNADHPPAETGKVGDRLATALRRIPNGVPVEACITRGAITESVLRVSEAAEADLVVITAHAGKSDEHASVIEHLLAHSNSAILALHDSGEDQDTLQFSRALERSLSVQTILVPTTLTTARHPQFEFAQELAQWLPVFVHVLHVIDKPSKNDAARSEDSIVAEIQALVAPGMVDRTVVHVDQGDPVTTIVDWAKKLSVSCIVMGEHTRVPVKRWLTSDTSRAILRQAPCPVWYVPSAAKPVRRSLSSYALSDEKSAFWGNV